MFLVIGFFYFDSYTFWLTLTNSLTFVSSNILVLISVLNNDVTHKFMVILLWFDFYRLKTVEVLIDGNWECNEFESKSWICMELQFN